MNLHRYVHAAAQKLAAYCTRPRTLLAAGALLLSGVGFEVQAQDTPTGTIRGRVENATNGASLENVTITLGGTNRQVRTNAYGEYVIRDVPAGEVTLRANYSVEAEQTASVSVAPGAEISQDFVFRSAPTTQRTEDGAVILDPFVINAERYRNARAIATAEERLSINIKNVVSVDEFGYIPSGNVGEFVKFLPGVQIDYGSSNGNNQGYSDNTANGISVRGFGPEDTAILIDGLPVASTIPGNLTRQAGLDQLTINNASRIEMIKVATPDMPANSVGGQVNLITRNAFEYAKPTYNTRVYFNFNSQHPDLKRTPGPTNKETFKITPGLDFSVSYPISKTLGISFTGAWAQEFTQSYRGESQWNNQYNNSFNNGSITNSAGQPSSLTNPVITRALVTDSSQMNERRSGNFRVDWRPTPNQLLRANVQYSTIDTVEGQRRLDFRPTLANGVTWDANQVVGTTGNSTTAMTVTTRDRVGDTISGQLQYEIDIAGFKIAAAGSLSMSESDFEDEANGHFSEVALNLNPGRVALYDLDMGIPGRVETYTRGANQVPRDYTLLNNWVFDGTTAKSGESHNERNIGLYKIDIERPLDFLPFLGGNSMSVKVGYRHDSEENIKSGRGSNYRQILRPGAAYNVNDLLDLDYLGQSPGFGLAAQQWASTYKMFEINESRDIFYVPEVDEPTNTRVENYNSYVGQQKDLEETIDAYYAQLTGHFFNNRLSFVGGARQETKDLTGRSPFTDGKWNFLKNKDGSLYTDAANPNGVTINSATSPVFANTAAGNLLRQNLTAAGIAVPTAVYGPTTGAGASLASRMLQYQPLRAVNEHKKGDPSYSLSGIYRITKKIDFKTAYSRSFKLPALESGNAGGLVSGTNAFEIREFTTSEQSGQSGALGEIRVANPGVKPETSNNLDFEVAYHTDTGGELKVAYWMKDITDQIMNFTTYSGTPTFDAVLGAIGLEPGEYEDWRVVTSTNSTTVQKPSGWEFEVRQDLSFLGGWGRRVSGFVSYAMNEQADIETPAPYTIVGPDGAQVTLVPTVATITQRADRFGGAGIQYAGKRFTAQIRGTYRNENEIADGRVLAANNNFVRRFQPEETRVDVNLSYVLTKRFSLFLSGRDVFNGERDQVWKDDAGLIPDYATLRDRRRFGVSWTVGVAGNF